MCDKKCDGSWNCSVEWNHHVQVNSIFSELEDCKSRWQQKVLLPVRKCCTCLVLDQQLGLFSFELKRVLRSDISWLLVI